jgi:hypothetical protein
MVQARVTTERIDVVEDETIDPALGLRWRVVLVGSNGARVEIAAFYLHYDAEDFAAAKRLIHLQ